MVKSDMTDSKHARAAKEGFSRRRVLEWGNALAGAGISGEGLGFGGDLLIRSTTNDARTSSTTSQTDPAVTTTETGPTSTYTTAGSSVNVTQTGPTINQT